MATQRAPEVVQLGLTLTEARLLYRRIEREIRLTRLEMERAGDTMTSNPSMAANIRRYRGMLRRMRPQIEQAEADRLDEGEYEEPEGIV